MLHASSPTLCADLTWVAAATRSEMQSRDVVGVRDRDSTNYLTKADVSLFTDSPLRSTIDTLYANSSLLKKPEFDEFGRSILLNSIKTGFQRMSGALQLEVASVNNKCFSMFVEQGALRGIRLIPLKKIPVESPHLINSLHLVGSAPLAVATPGSSSKSSSQLREKSFRRLLALLNHLVDGFSEGIANDVGNLTNKVDNMTADIKDIKNEIKYNLLTEAFCLAERMNYTNSVQYSTTAAASYYPHLP